MQSKRDGLIPIGEVFGGLDGPVKAIREASPQAVHPRVRPQLPAKMPRKRHTPMDKLDLKNQKSQNPR